MMYVKTDIEKEGYVLVKMQIEYLDVMQHFVRELMHCIHDWIAEQLIHNLLLMGKC